MVAGGPTEGADVVKEQQILPLLAGRSSAGSSRAWTWAVGGQAGRSAAAPSPASQAAGRFALTPPGLSGGGRARRGPWRHGQRSLPFGPCWSRRGGRLRRLLIEALDKAIAEVGAAPADALLLAALELSAPADALARWVDTILMAYREYLHLSRGFQPSSRPDKDIWILHPPPPSSRYVNAGGRWPLSPGWRAGSRRPALLGRGVPRGRDDPSRREGGPRSPFGWARPRRPTPAEPRRSPCAATGGMVAFDPARRRAAFGSPAWCVRHRRQVGGAGRGLDRGISARPVAGGRVLETRLVRDRRQPAHRPGHHAWPSAGWRPGSTTHRVALVTGQDADQPSS